MALYNEVLPEFQRFKAELLKISVDGVWCHAAFTRDRKLHFPLLADFEPKGAVAKLYGAFRHGDGIAERALFVIDKNGTIGWSYCFPIAVNPGADGILEAQSSLWICIPDRQSPSEEVRKTAAVRVSKFSVARNPSVC